MKSNLITASNTEICEALAEDTNLQAMSQGPQGAEILADKVCAPSVVMATVLIKSRLTLGECVILLRTVTGMCEQIIADDARRTASTNPDLAARLAMLSAETGETGETPKGSVN